MKPVVSVKTEIICSAIAAVGAVSVAAAITDFNPQPRTLTLASQEVNRAAKAGLLAFPDVAMMVARNGKADSGFVPVAAKLAVTPAPVRRNASAESAEETGPAGDTAAALAVVKGDHPAQTPDDAAVLPGDDGGDAVVAPVANTGERSKNFAGQLEKPSTPSGSAWRYSKDLMESAGQRARSLWDFLTGRD